MIGSHRRGLTMATETNHIRVIIEKLNALTPERIAEVEDFVDFLHQREHDRQLTFAISRAAESSFQKVWDNPDDAVYDSL
jgi:hypothetical protein